MGAVVPDKVMGVDRGDSDKSADLKESTKAMKTRK